MRILGLFLVLTSLSFAASPPALTDKEKAEIVENVYKKVFAALGTNEIAPKFEFNTTRARQIAYMTQDRDGNPLIGFESKAFDVCAQFGERRDDAIALLIGHEISHHSLKHHWGKAFRTAYSIEGLEKDMKDIDKASAKKFEAQADERGGILCYMAGYSTAGLAPELLRALYSSYEIQPSEKYPSLDERILIAKMQDSLVQNFIKVFETGNYAMAIGEYDLAIDCYQNVLNNEFTSREIINNIGVAYFLKGIGLAEVDDIKYVYPVELDLESKLNSRGSKGMGDDIRKIFEESASYFEKAIGYDKSYATAYLNLACAYSVLQDFRKARYNAEEVAYISDSLQDKFTRMNADLLLAIIEDLDPRGDKATAGKLFSDLSGKGHLLAQINEQIFEGTDLSELEYSKLPIAWMTGAPQSAVGGQKFPQQEVLSGFSSYALANLAMSISDDQEQELAIGRDRRLIIGNLKDSRVLVTTNSNGKYILFHSTLPNYAAGLKNGIKLKSTKDEVIKTLGTPTVAITTKQGNLLRYDGEKLLVLLNGDNKVQQIVSWRFDVQ